MNHQRNKNLRRIGRKRMIGNYPIAIGAFLVLSVISMAASLLATYICNSISPLFAMMLQADEKVVFVITSLILTFIVSLLLCIVSVGSVKIYLTILSGQKPTIGMLFWGFSNHADKILLANLPLTVISLVCSIPSTILSTTPIEELMAGGEHLIMLSLLSTILSIVLIIVSLPLYLVNYLLAEDNELSAKEILKTSIQMMKGNKWRLFCMTFSFLGWIFLASLSCGIGLLWIMPYMEASFAAFYKELNGTLYQTSQGVDGVVDEINYNNIS